MADLDVSAKILTSGGWVELEDEPNGHWLEENSFGQRAYSRRGTMLDGDWVDGSWAIRSTRGNVQEQVNVWVDGGGNPAIYTARAETVKNYFDQLSYQMEIRFGNSLEIWTCPQPGEYTETLNKPYRFATRGLIQVQVFRLPAITYMEVAV